MSWNSYTDSIINSGFSNGAAIYSRDGKGLWAESNGLIFNSQEIAEIAAGFDEPSHLQSNGLHYKGTKYFLLRADDRTIHAKHEVDGIFCVRTNQSIVIAHYTKGTQPNQCSTFVEKLADYLISLGY
ncbi:profilin [Ascoidea rubescens DSM 1968]|uniref:Profilin n=1 Tax=Ascoidea rubescens DSM 1968 TaxID=1344418 RepID=A0A1D2VL40_9ASCO|nr:Profilin/allergen [Ascoidea rubescens DSM 1968]ODV62315.1 Profilin/allergen [Ascoidea rubescens DSM 1968]